MYSVRITAVLICLTNIYFSFGQQTADTASNLKTQQILRYIASLPRRGKVLSGQFAGYSPDTFNYNLFDEFAQQTGGQIPAIIGCDYACGWNHKTPPHSIIDYSCNPSLKDHWKKGGLVTINMHLPNPVSPNGGGYKDRMNLYFPDMTNSQTDTGRRWLLFLDRMAEGLDDLQRAGITVLFRPLHEMNGDWFYWCNQDPETFKNVWKHMFNYLTDTKQLHNLLWIYSPDQSRSNPSAYYPGDGFVDIVGLDVYTDDPNSMMGYYEMININKPFSLTEVGPGSPNGQFDYTRWLTAISTKFTRVSYFLAWNDGWAPIKNQNAYSLYNDDRVITRAKLDINSGSSSDNTQTQTTSSSSVLLFNFSNGIGEWKGTNVIGGPWQSNEFVFKSTESLKADVMLSAGGTYTLYTRQQSPSHFSGRKRLTAEARVASWGFSNNDGMGAQLYIKVGSAWTWYDSGLVRINSSAATSLVLDLTKIPSSMLDDVREIGVEYSSNASGGQTAIYLSHITLQ